MLKIEGMKELRLKKGLKEAGLKICQTNR